MRVMNEGAQKAVGKKLRVMLASITGNRFAGVLTGLFATSVLQSSSATIALVISFVNARLLTLFGGIGVIMGANLGTTITAWIVAYAGVKIDIVDIALPVIGIGLPLALGRHYCKSAGEILIGFGLLLLGLGLLKDSVPDLESTLNSANPEQVGNAHFIQSFIETVSGYGFGSILIFFCIGIVLTIVVQSSSAAMAITVTFATNGWIGFPESAAIVLGENIGTTATAWFVSLAGNVDSKRAAFAHFLFNAFGVLWVFVVFYGFAEFVQWIGMSLPEALRVSKNHSTSIGFNLAIFHSLFNLMNICLLIGFVPTIVRVTEKWVTDGCQGELGKRVT
ncbi:MAG: Na/Pi cotransporter family protein [Verrucomicrobiae bacterium]|nr:Na/Pi cotransporter family protein [Verrucomicrobiae bacterium]